MSLLKPITRGPAYLKAGFLGFNGSGKTYTAVELALGARRMFKHQGPIAFFATEPGLSFFAERVEEETGQLPVGVESYALDDLIATVKECVAGGVSVLVVDSVTHVWREVCDSALKQINSRLVAGGKKTRQRLEMQDWGPIKAKWAEWSDLYVNAPLHIIICGRAGYEFDHDVDDETGKKTLVKTGVKMKTEGEFGFEPSLLVEMEREQVMGDDHRVVHKATVLKDRFGLIDAHWQENPTFEFFQPHVAKLTGGEHRAIDTSAKTDVGLDRDGGEDWHREKRQRAIFAEEIQGEIAKKYPGQTAAEKSARQSLLERHFGTLSWTKISESLPSTRLVAGLNSLRAELRPPANDQGDMPEWGGGAAPVSPEEAESIRREESKPALPAEGTAA